MILYQTYLDQTHQGFRPVCFVFERARASKHFLTFKGTNCKFLLEYFKSTKALTRTHGGNRLCCLREESVLRPTHKSSPNMSSQNHIKGQKQLNLLFWQIIWTTYKQITYNIMRSRLHSQLGSSKEIFSELITWENVTRWQTLY